MCMAGKPRKVKGIKHSQHYKGEMKCKALATLQKESKGQRTSGITRQTKRTASNSGFIDGEDQNNNRPMWTKDTIHGTLWSKTSEDTT